jgi:MFS transporter, DHA1 family, multidrug resistance protein
MLRPGSLGFIVLLGALNALNALAIDISLPALPALNQAFAAGADATQWTLSGFLIGFALGQLLCGPLADRYGRKPVLLGGLALFTLAGLGCASSPSLTMLIAWRMLQGIGACAGPILGRAVVRDVFDRERGARTLSHMAVVTAAAPLLAPILGGYLLDVVSWRVLFVVLGLAGIAALAAVAYGLRESLAMADRDALQPRRIAQNYRLFLSSRLVLGSAALVTFLFSGLFCYISSAPFVYIEVFGVKSDVFGYFFAIPALSLIGGGFANAALLRHYAGARLVQAGLVLMLGGALALGIGVVHGAGAFGVALPIMVYLFGAQLIVPNALAAALEPYPGMAGFVSSTIGCLQMGGAALAGWLVSILYDHSARPMGFGVLGLGGLAALTYLLWLRPRPIRALQVAE